MKTFIKALLAASMLMPAAAQAQEAGERGPGRRGDREWRAPGGPRAEAGGPQRAAEIGVDAQVRAERPQWRGERSGGPERQPWRGERPDRPQPPAPGAEARPGIGGGDRSPGWRRPDGADPRFERRPDGQRPDRGPAIGNDNRGNWDQRRQWDQRRDAERQQRDWNRSQADRRWGDQRYNGQNRGWDNRAWDRNGNGGWNDRSRFDRRDTWNRGWRNDGRYDWSRYRATNRGAYRLPRYYAPSGWGYGYRRFGIGVSLSPVLFAQSYWIDDPFAYRLPEAYGPYRWVRYYDDALLVDVRTGQVVDTVYDIFF